MSKRLRLNQDDHWHLVYRTAMDLASDDGSMYAGTDEEIEKRCRSLVYMAVCLLTEVDNRTPGGPDQG